MKYVAFDTETTGLKHEDCRIIELAAEVLDEDFNILDRMDMFVKLPEGERLPENITKLTGITDEMLIDEGVDEHIAANRFMDMINGDKVVLMAHNAAFDIAFIKDMFIRTGIPVEKLCSVDYIDTLTISKDRKLYPHRLQDMIDHYGLKAQNSHRAIDDAHAVAELYRALLNERRDTSAYLNIFGYNPKYGIYDQALEKIKFLPQPYRRYGDVVPDWNILPRLGR